MHRSEDRTHRTRRRTSAILRVCAMAALVVAALVPSVSPVAAADGPTMEARVLLEGQARVGAWMAIQVRLTNDGPPIVGELRLSTGQSSRTRFGTPVEYPFVHGISGFPEIIEVAKLEHEKTNFGGIWHSDTTYLEEPPMGSMLLAREVPPQGGDTIFANQYLAYEALSDGMKRMLDGLRALSSSAKADVTKTREDRMRDRGRYEGKQVYQALHPVVRTHPETGRKALYVNVGHTVRFKNMTEEESAPLLDFLYAHQTRPELTCRFNWRVGSIAFWDNRAAQHYPINDYHGYRRVMHRITLAGDVPR